MTSKERVLKAIKHQEADRVPLNVWLYRTDYNEIINKKYGTVDNFFDEFGIDIFTIFVSPPWSNIENRPMTLDEALSVKLIDPYTDSLYDGVRWAVETYGKGKNMCVFCQTGGVFETANGFIGIENNLANMACEPHKTKDLFKKLSEWFCVQSEMIIKCGVDVLHISDDWGENNRMLFSPQMWRDMIFPYDKAIVDVGKKAGVPVSLHSCGYIMDILEDCVELGLDVLNPIQTSAGMDAFEVKKIIGDKICLYGTLDTREVLPKYSPEKIDTEVKMLMDGLKSKGGYIFCSAHTINPDVPLENLEAAYRAALRYGVYKK